MEINKTYIYNGQPLGQKRTMKPVRPNRSGLLGYLQNLNSGEFLAHAQSDLHVVLKDIMIVILRLLEIVAFQAYVSCFGSCKLIVRLVAQSKSF